MRLLDDLIGERQGVLPSLVDEGADLILGVVEPLLVFGEQPLALIAGLLGFVEHVFQVLFPMVERLQQGLPRELAEHEHQAEEDDDGPDGQRRLRLNRVFRPSTRSGGGGRGVPGLVMGHRRGVALRLVGRRGEGRRAERREAKHQGQGQQPGGPDRLPGHG